MIQELGLEAHAHLAGPSTNLAEVYPAFNILAQTSRSEGLPLVLLEAMACGCPIVAMIVGGVREIVENERTGLIVFPDHWEGLASRLSELLGAPERLPAMGWAARQRAETLFDIRLSAQLTADLLRQMVRAGVSRQGVVT
jgi:glycosyltransferase involved in cell wall biosynthesis